MRLFRWHYRLSVLPFIAKIYSKVIKKDTMPSSKEYLQYIIEQLSDLEEITTRAMMGEYIIYYRVKIVGGIYDDRQLV